MKIYNSYNFVDKDPVIDQMRTAIQDSGVTFAYIEQKSGVGKSTLHAWFNGRTKRPQHTTVMAVLRAIGYDLVLTKTDKVKPAPRPFAGVKFTQKLLAKGKRA